MPSERPTWGTAAKIDHDIEDFADRDAHELAWSVDRLK